MSEARRSYSPEQNPTVEAVWVDVRYSFHCPACRHANRFDDDPRGEIRECDSCGREYGLLMPMSAIEKARSSQ